MTAFHCGSDGARVDDVIAEIGAGVNAGNHDIRTGTHQGVDAEID